MDYIKNAFLILISTLGAWFINMFGGWDWSLQSLIVFISIDFILGLLIAAVWGKSNKTVTGKLDSKACWQGLIRKGGILLVVLIATQLDRVTATGGFVRTAVILYFIGNEGISIIENLGIMGVPLPEWLKDKFESLRVKNEKLDK